ncbi:MAG: hypothetical protein JWQ48_4048, partial [Conexibacter sp.]|nr:hypothetical protein [Conexibacter sp.]
VPGVELVALACAAGEVALARDVVSALAARADESELVAALATRGEGLIADDPAVLQEAARHLGALGASGLQARATEEAAGALARRGRTAEAVALLQAALAADESSGALRDAARVEAALRALGVRRGVRGSRDATGWESLTRTQRAVAELVAQGLTNGEVAGRLFVSPRTVETHVSHVLRKLEVRSRKDVIALGARRAALGEPAAPVEER